MASTSLDDTQVDDTEIVEPPGMQMNSSSPDKREWEVEIDVEFKELIKIRWEVDRKFHREMQMMSRSPDKRKREVEIVVEFEELITKLGELDRKFYREILRRGHPPDDEFDYKFEELIEKRGGVARKFYREMLRMGSSPDKRKREVEIDIEFEELIKKLWKLGQIFYRELRKWRGTLDHEIAVEFVELLKKRLEVDRKFYREMLMMSSSPDKRKREVEIDVEFEELIKKRGELIKKIDGEMLSIYQYKRKREVKHEKKPEELMRGELIKQSGGTKSNTEPNEVMETHVKRYNDNPVFTSDGSVEHQLLRSVQRGNYDRVCYTLSTISENYSVSEKSFKNVLDVSIRLRNREITNRLLIYASQLLKKKRPGEIQDVWPAYEETCEWAPVFVVTYLSILMYPEDHYLGCRILRRKCDDVSDEGIIVANSAEVRDNPLSYDEMINLKKLIKTANLFKHHKKIAIVNACPCKSRNGGQDISQEKCIVIYTPIKGFIPFDEQSFPKSIGGVPVDVREAYVKLGMLRRKDRPHHDRQQSHSDDKSWSTPTPDAGYNSSAHRPSVSHIPETNSRNKNTCKQPLPDTPFRMDGLYNNNIHHSTANYSNTGSVENILASRDDTTAVQSSLQQLSLEEPMEVDVAQVQVLPNRANPGRDYNEKLLMGTEIGLYGNGLRGTLGAFVPLPNGDVGALTCAHVMSVFHGDCDEDVSKIVTQPSVEPMGHDDPSLERFKIGHLYKAVFSTGCSDDVSIDAAIIKVESRCTEKAEFIDTETSILETILETAGLDPSQPPSFTKGQILKFDQLLHYRLNKVIKYGSQSNLTLGEIHNLSSDIKSYDSSGMLPNKTEVEFFNQIEILPVKGFTTFFEGGDSGSLVFMSLDNVPELYCIGLAVGWTSYGSCIVTPIENVLKKLGLPDKFIDYSNS